MSGAKHIPDYATKTSRSTSVWFNSRRMIMCFNFDADIVVTIKANNSGIISEDTDTPVVWPKLLSDGFG
jgi:hypothetical protein